MQQSAGIQGMPGPSTSFGRIDRGHDPQRVDVCGQWELDKNAVDVGLTHVSRRDDGRFAVPLR